MSQGVSLGQGRVRARVAQGGVTLGPEQGEPGADFNPLGVHLRAFQFRSLDCILSY
jgi:hypothetical protein